MTLDLKKKSRKDIPRRRKRKRSKPEQEKIQSSCVPDFKHMISIKDKLPPDTHDPILMWGPIRNWEVNTGFRIRQHIDYMLDNYQILAATHWYPLDRM